MRAAPKRAARIGNEILHLMIRVIPGMDQAGIGQCFHLGVLDQLFGTDRGAKAAVVALGIVDNSQILGNGNGILGADLFTQTAAHTADSTATGCDGALGQGVTGNDYIVTGFYRRDQPTGAGRRTGHTAYTQVLVHHGNTVLDGNSAVLALLNAGTIAQTTKLTGQGASAAHLGSRQAIVNTFVITL